MKSFLFRLTCITFLACLQAAPSRAVQIKVGVCPVTAAFALSANAPSAAVTVQPDESVFTHLHTEKAMANVTVSPGRAGPVVIAIQLETTDELPLQAKSVSVTLTNATASAEPQVASGTNRRRPMASENVCPIARTLDARAWHFNFRYGQGQHRIADPDPLTALHANPAL